MNINTYLNEITKLNDALDEKLNEKASQASERIKNITKELANNKVPSFGYGWTENEEVDSLSSSITLNLALTWNKPKQKILFYFENEEPVSALGTNRHTRILINNVLEDFLKAGIKEMKKTLEGV